MLSTFRSHVRHNVVGYFALFFALTGVAYAAGPLKPGDPAGGDLAGTYPNPSIAGDAVTSGKVSDDSLTGADIDESSLAKVGDADTLDGRDSRDFARFSGVVQSDGTVFSGSGFTASRLSEGEYEVAFPAGTLSNANCPPAVVAIPFGPPLRLPMLGGRVCSGSGAGRVTITILDEGGVAHNTPFAFIAM